MKNKFKIALWTEIELKEIAGIDIAVKMNMLPIRMFFYLLEIIPHKYGAVCNEKWSRKNGILDNMDRKI